jgi:hypothetical protein
MSEACDFKYYNAQWNTNDKITNKYTLIFIRCFEIQDNERRTLVNENRGKMIMGNCP